MAKTKSKSSTNGTGIKFFAALIKELGIPAFIVLFFTICFIYFADSHQKSEFIDKFFLFKDVNNNPFPFAFVVLVLILVIILQYIYTSKIIKALKDENDRIGQEKSQLQETLLNKKLHSSKNK